MRMIVKEERKRKKRNGIRKEVCLCEQTARKTCVGKSKGAIVVSAVHIHFLAKPTPTLVSFAPCFLLPFGDKDCQHTDGVKGISLPLFSFLFSCTTSPDNRQGIRGG